MTATIPMLNVGCGLGYPDAEPCGKPQRFYALAAYPPEDWTDAAPPASLGAYCCLEHANAEPRPSLADAQRIYRHVLDSTKNDNPVRKV